MLAALRAVQWDCRVTKCFVTGRRTNLVVNASTDPPAEVVKRANRTPLYIRRVSHRRATTGVSTESSGRRQAPVAAPFPQVFLRLRPFARKECHLLAAEKIRFHRVGRWEILK
ncbi:hypothetical protein DIPPA_12915 [Diplonema papillatum]|nr:hypothetical protein DIPPA_12915 [Diplonema papillatum]